MPLITLPRLPRSGENILRPSDSSDPLDPITESIHHPLDLAGPEKGLMSGANGRLGSNNLSPDFLVGAEHVQKEQAMLSRSESMIESSTIYGTGLANNTRVAETNDFAGERFVTVPGCSIRWYQPYDTTASILQWSFFFSYNNWRGVYRDAFGTEHGEGVNTTMKIRCLLNGDPVTASERVIGQNMFHPVSPGASYDGNKSPGLSLYRLGQDGPTMSSYKSGVSDRALRGGNPRYVQTEAHSAHYVDLHHMTSLSKGYNEISIQCATLLPQGDVVYLQNVGAYKRGVFKMRGFFNLVGKLSFGIRNARVLNFL